MILFIFSCLSIFITVFLIMVSIQIIRLEKLVSEIDEIAEGNVEKMYGKF